MAPDPPPTPRSPFHELVLCPVLLLLLVVLGVHVVSVPGDFVWLDHAEIEEGGYRLRNGSEFVALWTHTLDRYVERDTGHLEAPAGYWRPIHALSISLDWALWNGRAWLYHVENIFWHALVVCGLYLLGMRMLGATIAGSRAVFWGTLLFAVHPLCVHGVTWISGRKDLLCSFFAVASLLALTQPSLTMRRRSWWILIAVAAAALSMASKELGLVLPAVATVILLLPAREAKPAVEQRPRFAGLVVTLLWCVAGGYLAYRHWVLGGIGLGADRAGDGVWATIGLHARLLCAYFAAMFVPHVSSISDSVHLAPPFPGSDWLAIGYVAGTLTFAVIAIVRRWRVTPFVWWYLLWMLPACGIVPLRHLYAERYLYPAAWGLFVTAAYMGASVVGRLDSNAGKKIALGVATALVVIFATTTIYGQWLWWNDERLFTHAVSRDPHFIEGHVALGNVDLRADRPAAAIERFQRALRLSEVPGWRSYYSPLVLHHNLGVALYRAGRFDEAKDQFLVSLRIRPRQAMAHYQLGLIASAMGRHDSAQTFYQQALHEDPTHFLAQSNLAHAHLQLGEFQDAIRILAPLVERRPDDPQNRMNLASAFLAAKDFGAAKPHLAHLASLRPSDAVVLAKLAWSEFETGETERALQHIARATALAPGNPVVRSVDAILRE